MHRDPEGSPHGRAARSQQDAGGAASASDAPKVHAGSDDFEADITADITADIAADITAG